MDWKIKSRSPVENGDSNYCEPAAQVIDTKSIQVRPGPITFVCKVRLHIAWFMLERRRERVVRQILPMLKLSLNEVKPEA